MKKIYFVVLLLPFLLQSCLKDDHDIFSESAADRLQQTLKHHQEILMEASNGWVIEYFPNKEQIYGGFSLFLKFGEKNQVTIASELANASQTETSLYQLIGDSGPVLTFNTHNSLFHYFSDPKNPDGIGKEGIGMEGDYEFLILEATPELIKMKGKKTGNIIIMTPLAKGTQWSEVMNKYKVASRRFCYKKYEYEIKGIKANVTSSNNNLTFSFRGEDGTTKTDKIAYITNPEGLTFYRPISIGGVEVKKMLFKQEGTNLYFVDANGSGAKLNVVVFPLNEQLLNEKWYFSYSEISSLGQEKWNSTKNELESIKEKLYVMHFGEKDDKFGVYFTTLVKGILPADGGVLNNGLLGLTYTLNGENEIQFTYSRIGSTSLGKAYYSMYKFNNLLFPITSGTTNTRTFTLSSDNALEPSWIELQDKDMTGNRIKVHKDIILFPFEN